jgi:hypothetical protein
VALPKGGIVTARDEAARAIWDALTNLSGGEVAHLVDALPGDVLVRLAIERGVLAAVTTDLRGIGMPRLYRVVES